MNKLVLAIALLALGSAAQAATCADHAAEKKLAGAAKNSFMTKCEKDSAAACETQAAEKKLAGAAKNSFVKKCTSDHAGHK